MTRSYWKQLTPDNNPSTFCNFMATSESSHYNEHIPRELSELCDSSVTKLYSKNGRLQHIDVFVHIYRYVTRLLLLINYTRKQHNTTGTEILESTVILFDNLPHVHVQFLITRVPFFSLPRSHCLSPSCHENTEIIYYIELWVEHRENTPK